MNQDAREIWKVIKKHLFKQQANRQTCIFRVDYFKELQFNKEAHPEAGIGNWKLQ